MGAAPESHLTSFPRRKGNDQQSSELGAGESVSALARAYGVSRASIIGIRGNASQSVNAA